MLDKISEKLQKLIYLIFLYYFCIYVPLYMNDGFFDILEAKFYAIYNNRYFLYMLFLMSLLLVAYDNRKDIRKQVNGFDILLTVFALLSYLSSRLSLSFMSAWKGVSGYGVGGFIIITSVILIIVLSKLKRPKAVFYIPLYMVNIFIFALVFIEGMGFDPLATHQNLVMNQYFSYFSTIGNTNWFSAYLCMFLFMCFGYYLNNSGFVKEALCLIMMSLCILCIPVLYADSIVIAIFFCVVFSFPYVMNDYVRFKKAVNLLLVFGICLVFMAYAPFFADLLKSHNSGIYRCILNKVFVILIFLIVCLITYCVYKKTDIRWFEANKRVLLKEMESILIISASVVLILSIFMQGMEWGNGRMDLWAYSIKKFLGFGIKNKFLGIGPENLAMVYSGFSIDNGTFFTVAHSEFVQVLLTMGILGFVVFICLWSNIFYTFFKNKLWLDGYKMMILMPIVAYFGQSLVNSATIPNVMLLCFIVGEFARK